MTKRKKIAKKGTDLKLLFKVLKGSSLLEVTIAMGIVFFLLTGLAQMMGSSLLIKQKADYHHLAADIFSNQLELLKSAGVDAPDLLPGLHQETVEEPDSGKKFLLNWEVVDVNNDLKKVHLSLCPASLSQRLPEVRATLYFSRHLNF
ncbi:MAG: hypothetical protein WBK32_01745 [Candidatus Saccharicenans sp.]|jgi:Tfp pilus assembly protein PilV|nr:hypothetical protein [Candidatus Saccharicenans sp.]